MAVKTFENGKERQNLTHISLARLVQSQICLKMTLKTLRNCKSISKLARKPCQGPNSRQNDTERQNLSHFSLRSLLWSLILLKMAMIAFKKSETTSKLARVPCDGPNLR